MYFFPARTTRAAASSLTIVIYDKPGAMAALTSLKVPFLQKASGSVQQPTRGVATPACSPLPTCQLDVLRLVRFGPCLQAKATALGRVRLAIEDVAKEGRVSDRYALLEAQVRRRVQRLFVVGVWVSTERFVVLPTCCGCRRRRRPPAAAAAAAVADADAALARCLPGLPPPSPPHTLPLLRNTLGKPHPRHAHMPPSSPSPLMQTGEVHLNLAWNPIELVDEPAMPKE